MEITDCGEIQSEITLFIVISNTVTENFIMQTQIHTNPRVTPQRLANYASGIEDYRNLDADGRYCYTVFQSKLADFRRKTRVVAETAERASP